MQELSFDNESVACGRKVLCKGSREDVVLSRLQSGSGGRAGYLVELGKQAMLENTVDIFETESEENVVSVARQEEFRKQWFDSLN